MSIIKGLGIDIIEIARIAGELENYGDTFTERIFTREEIDYCEKKAHRAQHYAVRFAAKEAAFKALGTGWQEGVGWREVAVKNDALGKPALEMTGRAAELAEKKSVTVMQLSLSHCRDYAAAVVILEG